MSFDEDDEILQDFLVEAGEILELLSEQLVDLEQRPDDYDLLNAIFRGFHTVKGGAGFLQLNPLVDCCHEAENVFDILRNGQRKVTSDLMDVILKALDAVNEMFDAVRSGQKPEPADPELLKVLHSLAQPETEEAPAAEESLPDAVVETEAAIESAPVSGGESEDITDDEFEQLLDALDGDAASTAAAPAASDDVGLGDDDIFFDVSDEPVVESTSDEITEDEFEALLDQIHGSGKGATSGSEKAPEEAKPAEAAPSGDSDLITDSEFEDLLDRLHGKGPNPATAEEASQPAETVAPKAEVVNLLQKPRVSPQQNLQASP